MSMISEQVNRLRGYAEACRTVSDHITAKYLDGAADTIEELSAKLHNSQMERSSQYYNGGWIPVSERLPEDHQLVLTFDGEYICVEQRIPYIIGENGEHIESEWWVDVNYDPDSELYSGLRDGAAVAWMPLPDPYKEEGSEE